ncbi:MAG: tetratricopeptide repeat protein [Chloroflexales bacterium]|nr:tetratricopeptide repeat protein [Chloroflexales bacterium]
MSNASEFGRLLHRLRRERDLTQEALGQAAFCSRDTVKKLEAAQRRPSRQLATQLADVLGLSGTQRATFLAAARASPAPGDDEEQDVTSDAPQTAQPLDMPPPLHPSAPAPQDQALPITASQPAQSNLPPLAAPCIGREAELALIAGRLADQGCRLLTLLGPGGIGKTRLALEAAAVQRERFSHGVYFVALVGVDTSDLLGSTIADALGLSHFGETDAETQLLAFLRERRLLLLLDNVEHLLDGTRLLARILDHASGVKLFVTSRERLNLLEEWLVPLDGLRVPEGDQPAQGAEEYGAVALFVQRAARVQPGFVLTPEVWPAVLQICRLVQGLPLGLELAAALVRLMPCAEIAAEIAHSLDVLTSTARDVSDRHRSLRAAFTYSWRTLTAEEQGVFARLAIFRGGFRREAAAQVAGASLAILSALVDKSLLVTRPSGRYELHEALRQYAAECLADAGDAEQTADRHSAYYLGLLQYRMFAPDHNIDERAAQAAVAAEIDNVRAAWIWTVERRRIERIAAAMHGLSLFYQTYGLFAEGIERFRLLAKHAAEAVDEPRLLREYLIGFALVTEGWLHVHLRQFDLAYSCVDSYESLEQAGMPAALRANYLLLRGMLAAILGPYREAETPLRACIMLTEEHGLRLIRGFAFQGLGLACMALGRNEEARQHLGEGLVDHQAIGHSRGIVGGLQFLGDVARSLGNSAEAQRCYQESLSVGLAADDKVGAAASLLRLGLLAQAVGQHAEAERRFQESLEVCLAVGHSLGAATALGNLGRLAFTQGDAAGAVRLHRASLERSRESGSQRSVSSSLCHLGLAECALGELHAARHLLTEALRTAQAVGAQDLTLDALGALAELLAAEGRLERAVDLLALVHHHPAAPQRSRRRGERLLSELTRRLPTERIDRAIQRGTAHDLEAAANALLAEIGV